MTPLCASASARASDNAWRPPAFVRTMAVAVSLLFLHIPHAVLHVLAQTKRTHLHQTHSAEAALQNPGQ